VDCPSLAVRPARLRIHNLAASTARVLPATEIASPTSCIRPRMGSLAK
jgi:hypothetical protein